TVKFVRCGLRQRPSSNSAFHRVRSTWIATRTARINTARGILREFGIVVADGASRVPGRVTELIEDADTELPMGVRDLLNELVGEFRATWTSRIRPSHRRPLGVRTRHCVVEPRPSLVGDVRLGQAPSSLGVPQDAVAHMNSSAPEDYLIVPFRLPFIRILRNRWQRCKRTL